MSTCFLDTYVHDCVLLGFVCMNISYVAHEETLSFPTIGFYLFLFLCLSEVSTGIGNLNFKVESTWSRMKNHTVTVEFNICPIIKVLI